jgi:hypothetical protein
MTDQPQLEPSKLLSCEKFSIESTVQSPEQCILLVVMVAGRRPDSAEGASHEFYQSGERALINCRLVEIPVLNPITT